MGQNTTGKPPTAEELAFYKMINDDPEAWAAFVANPESSLGYQGGPIKTGYNPTPPITPVWDPNDLNLGSGSNDPYGPNYVPSPPGGGTYAPPGGTPGGNPNQDVLDFYQAINDNPQGWIDWLEENGYGNPYGTPGGGTGGGTGGGGSGGTGGGTGGGYTPPVYQPTDLRGYESSSNKDFYQQQFAQMLGQQNNQKGSDYAAAMRQQQAQNAPPPAPIDYEQMWAERGVTPAQAVQGGAGPDGQYVWGLAPEFSGAAPGTLTNADIYGGVAAKMPASSAAIISNFFNENPQAASNLNWGNYGSPQAATAALKPNLSSGFRDALSDLFGAAYVRQDLATPVGGGPTAVTGYALPVSGGK